MSDNVLPAIEVKGENRRIGNRRPFFSPIPKKLGRSLFGFQFFLLFPVVVFFSLLMTGVIPEVPTNPTYDEVKTEVSVSESISSVASEPSVDALVNTFWVPGSGISAVLTWWSVFAVTISACCWGLLLSYSARGGIRASEVEDGSMAFSIDVLGVVFGTMTVMVFLGGFVAGTLFPDFSDTGFRRIYFTMSSPQNWAKLIVWGFVAGFVERMIPDLVERLAQKVQAEGN